MSRSEYADVKAADLKRRLSGGSAAVPAAHAFDSIADRCAHRTPDAWKVRVPERVLYRTVAIFGPVTLGELLGALPWMQRFRLNQASRDLGPQQVLGFLDLLEADRLLECDDGAWQAAPYRVADAPRVPCEFVTCTAEMPVTRVQCHGRSCNPIEIVGEEIVGVAFHPDKAVQERKWQWMNRAHPNRRHWRRNERASAVAAHRETLRELQRQRIASDAFRQAQLDQAIAEATGELAELIAAQVEDDRRRSIAAFSVSLDQVSSDGGHDRYDYTPAGSGNHAVPRYQVEWLDPTADRVLELADQLWPEVDDALA